MALVLAWREQAIERIWIVSDSRLSREGQTGPVRLTDAAAKILSVPVILRRQTPLSLLGTPVLVNNLAFAYAGNSLIAMQAYAAILPLWSHLQTSGPETLPSVRAFAEHLGKFLLAYTEHVSSAHNEFQPCQCAIIGYDSAAQTIEGWIVRPMVVAWPPKAVRTLAATRHYIPLNVPLVKRVAAAPGDRVCARGTLIRVNGHAVVRRLARDGAGRAMPWWNGCRTLGEDALFLLMTDSPASFDGRCRDEPLHPLLGQTVRFRRRPARQRVRA